jgi:uncharacterized membrane protein
MEKNRLEAFSDGVLAVIITIMVLEMKAPHDASWENLKPLMPVFSSYILSFLFVAIYWVNHHHLLHTVKKVNSAIMWANLNLLFWLSLIPFATNWMGENHFASFTVATYALLALLCGVSFSILQFAIAKTYTSDTSFKDISDKKKWKSITSTILYTVAIPIAFLNPLTSGLLFLSVSIMWLIPDKDIEKILNTGE